jgi:hypothetical protein
MSVGILGTFLPVQAVHAANVTPKTQIQQSNFKTGILFEDNTFKVTQTDNSRTVLDKKTNRMAVLTFTNSNHPKGIFKDANGNIKKYSTNAAGNIYLDNVVVVKATRSAVPTTNATLAADDYTNPVYFTGSDGFTYYYVTEYTYSTKTAGDVDSLALDLLSLVPVIGPLYTIIEAIQTASSFG